MMLRYSNKQIRIHREFLSRFIERRFMKDKMVLEIMIALIIEVYTD